MLERYFSNNQNAFNPWSFRKLINKIGFFEFMFTTTTIDVLG